MSGQHPFPKWHLSAALVAILTCWSTLSAQETDEKKAETPEPTMAERIAKLDSQLAENAEKVRRLNDEKSTLERQAFDLNLKQKFLAGQLRSLDQSDTEFRQQLEGLLKDSNQWVSFSQQVAPIFRDRCVACHNSKKPKGQYNMSSYALIMGPGESGRAVIPGKSSESPLFQLIVDHSMPQDAQPLDADSIELVRRWIDFGARLDVGVSATDELYRITPRPIHPPAPEHYAASLPVSALAINLNGDLLATGGYHEVLLWSLPDGKLIRRLGNLAERIHSLRFLTDGKQLAIASGTPGMLGEAKIVNTENGQVSNDLSISSDSILTLALSPDGQRLAVGDSTGVIKLFQISGDSAIPYLRIDDHSDWINHLSWSSNGRQLISACRDKTSKVFDATTGASIVTFSGHMANVTSALMLGDSGTAASVGEDRRLRIWNLSEGKQLHEYHELAESCVSLLPLSDRRLLMVPQQGPLVWLDWNAKQLRLQMLSGRGRLHAVPRNGESELILSDLSGNVSQVELLDSSITEKNSFAARP